MKRKSETQGGEGKRRRSSGTETSRIDSPVSATSSTPEVPLDAKSTTPPHVPATSSTSPVSTKSERALGSLLGFEHYSDSEDSE